MSDDQWSDAEIERYVATTVRELKVKENIALRRRAENAEKQLKALQRSPWWRITAPGRKLLRKARDRNPTAPKKDESLNSKVQPIILPTRTIAEQVVDRQAALLRRLKVVASEYDKSRPEAELDEVLDIVVELLTTRGDDRALLWLLFIAFTATYPDAQEMEKFSSDLALDGPTELVTALLADNSARKESWSLYATIDLVRTPVAEVTHTANFPLHTGIQRVVREVVPRWVRDHDLKIGLFDYQALVLRHPTHNETGRVTRWGSHVDPRTEAPRTDVPDAILVPWGTSLLIPEVTARKPRAERLVTLAGWSGNTINGLFYDLIPFALPEACDGGTRNIYAEYTAIIRSSSRISTISETVATDLRGMCVSYQNMGFPGPVVLSHPLPVQAPSVSAEVLEQNRADLFAVPGAPIVLSVASIEPRKNHLSTLRAAERLWREGLNFQLIFIAGSAWTKELFEIEFAKLQERGRPVRVIRGASEGTLWSAYRLASFTVFVSFAEGFGLPAAESIAAGTPVVLSDVGSMAEIGEGGGVELVNPRNLDEITDAMRTLLTKSERLDDLREQARSRVLGTWDGYAEATWEWLVNGNDARHPAQS